VCEVGLDGSLHDAELTCYLLVAQPGQDEANNLLLPMAEGILDRRIRRAGRDRTRHELVDREGHHAPARPHLALIDDPDGLAKMLYGGVLREYAPDPGLERMHGPVFIPIGFNQDHPRPRPTPDELAAYAESALDLRIDQNDIRRASPHENEVASATTSNDRSAPRMLRSPERSSTLALRRASRITADSDRDRQTTSTNGQAPASARGSRGVIAEILCEDVSDVGIDLGVEFWTIPY